MARDPERADEQDMPAGGRNDVNEERVRGMGEDTRGLAAEEDEAFEDADDLEEDEDEEAL
jgi:hypothetical protein